jgi:hypothetical protein
MSDVHINALTGERCLSRMTKAARDANGDLLLMLGDFVDTDMRGKNKEAALFGEIPARLGKYAVLGNHEAYSGLQNSLNFTQAAGFTVLRNEAVQEGGIVIAGLTMPCSSRGAEKTVPLLKKAPPSHCCKALSGNARKSVLYYFCATGPACKKKSPGFLTCSFQGTPTADKSGRRAFSPKGPTVSPAGLPR